MPSRARPGPSLPLPTGLGPPESSTGPSPVDTFTLPPFLPSRGRPGSSPLDLWQCKRGYSHTSLHSLSARCFVLLYHPVPGVLIDSNYTGEGSTEMFYLTMHLTHFYLRLYGVGYMVEEHSDSERGNSLPPHGLLFPINSKGSFICTIPLTG